MAIGIGSAEENVHLHDIIGEMEKILFAIAADLGKSGRGNKAASQRVRVNTVLFEKVAKRYRKESLLPKAKEKIGKSSRRKRKK
jgi:hypothetical protein